MELPTALQRWNCASSPAEQDPTLGDTVCGNSAEGGLEQRIRQLEELTTSQSRELRIQFERIAQLQAELDILRIRSSRRNGEGYPAR